MILCGGTPEDRHSFISQTREAFLERWPAAAIFTLTEHIGDADRYLKSVRKEFPVESSDKNKYDLSRDQLNDSYLGWVKKHKSVLVIIPEIQKLYKNQPNYFYQIMGDYMAAQQSLAGHCVLRFLATLNESYPIDVKKVPVLIGGNWRPSEKDLGVVVL